MKEFDMNESYEDFYKRMSEGNTIAEAYYSVWLEADKKARMLNILSVVLEFLSVICFGIGVFCEGFRAIAIIGGWTFLFLGVYADLSARNQRIWSAILSDMIMRMKERGEIMERLDKLEDKNA